MWGGAGEGCRGAERRKEREKRREKFEVRNGRCAPGEIASSAGAGGECGEPARVTTGERNERGGWSVGGRCAAAGTGGAEEVGGRRVLTRCGVFERRDARARDRPLRKSRPGFPRRFCTRRRQRGGGRIAAPPGPCAPIPCPRMSGPLAQRKVAEDYDVRPRRAIPFPLRVPAPAAVKNASCIAVDLAVVPVAVAAAVGWGGGVPRGEGGKSTCGRYRGPRITHNRKMLIGGKE